MSARDRTMSRPAVPLKRSLTFNLTVGVAVLGTVLLAIALAATDRIVLKLSGALTNRVIAATDAQIMAFFEPVHAAIEVTAERVFGGDFESFPLEAMDRYFVPLVERMPQISSVMYAHANGDEYMLLKTAGHWESRLTRPESWGTNELRRIWTPDGAISEARRPLDYDARSRPWHAGALATLARVSEDAPLRDRTHWTAPYTFFTTHEPGVTASLAHRTRTGRLVVLGFDILLADISRYTSRLVVGERGRVFVLRGPPDDPRNMVVIGVPADARQPVDASRVRFVLSPPHHLGGPVASFATESLAQHVEKPGIAVPFQHEGERWWGEIARSRIETSDDIWVGAVVPETELLEGLPRAGLLVALTTAVVLVLALWRASWLARRYAAPLELLTEHGNRMQRLDFEPVTPVESDISEIRNLSGTLERMRDALRSFSAVREDLRVARAIRATLVPDAIPQALGVDVATWSETADEIGGEFADVVVLTDDVGDGVARPVGATAGRDAPGDSPTASVVTGVSTIDGGAVHVLVALIDSPGTGVEAAMRCANLRVAIRNAARLGLDLESIAAHLEASLLADLPRAAPLRGWLAKISPRSGVLELFGFGDLPAVVRQGNSIARIAPCRGPLGLGLRPAVRSPPVRFTRGDVLVLASDGVLDALDPARRRYGIERLERVTVDGGGLDAGQLVDHIRGDLTRHTEGRDDGDRTLAVVASTAL